MGVDKVWGLGSKGFREKEPLWLAESAGKKDVLVVYLPKRRRSNNFQNPMLIMILRNSIRVEKCSWGALVLCAVWVRFFDRGSA